ncbi:MAG TPA: PPC domain-containing DNA-binding protein [Candidatus Bathyarchaeia archaeon]|nr:PPC domain-containing DNA-binding protein [Candidatus Bathyarchaeia archaeon]
MQVNQGRIFLGRFAAGEDLLGSLTALCRNENIRLGIFSIIGALRRVELGYYDQSKQEYIHSVSLPGKYEITCCMGNISLKDTAIFAHAHMTVADQDGNAFGGHLMPGSEIFAAEYSIQELTGAEFHRGPDAETGLSLWEDPVVLGE